MRVTRDRAVQACQRCRRQKLKCDVQKPCALCNRAGAECIAVEADIWRAGRREDERDRRQRKRVRHAMPSGLSRSSGRTPSVEPRSTRAERPLSNSTQNEPVEAGSSDGKTASTPWHSSSTMTFIEQAFRYHDTTSPGDVCTTALRTSQHPQESPSGSELRARPAQSAAHHTVRRGLMSSTQSHSAIAELTGLLPSKEPATLLMDTYFDRVHWFMLLFHQDEFRSMFRTLWPSGQEGSGSVYLGDLSTALTVCAIGLQYIGKYREEILAGFNIDAAVLKEQILGALGRRLLEILALGSLETVQTCVLLGTYYLYHGQPDLAWPICGCGLRIAQAIGLHRHVDLNSSLSPERLDSQRRANEARKRCWWAIYEIETFCSMLYGLPLSIMDNDCTVEFLDPFAQCPRAAPGTPDSAATAMLFYKPMMSKLSVIIKSALTDLYKIRPDSVGMRTDSSAPTAHLRRMIEKVYDLDARLSAWSNEVPSELRTPSSSEPESGTYSNEELEKNVGASGAKFETLILRLQALALKLAYENARILIHRPLLSYRMITRSSSEPARSFSGFSDPCQLSVQTCREAALQTSGLGALSIFQHACDTYAVAFVGMHLLTAGTTLCVLASLEPLSNESHQSKLGVQRLMKMQTYVKPRSILADQGVEILKKLVALIMKKELAVLLDTPGESGIANGTAGTGQESDHPDPHVIRTGDSAPAHPSAGFPIAETQTEPQVPSPVQQNPLAEGLPFPADDITNPMYEYYEDESIMQAILNAEQGEPFHTAPLAAPERCFEYSFMNQEQGWIWSHDFSQIGP